MVNTSEWTYCEDRLPNTTGKYLVCYPNGTIDVSRIVFNTDGYFWVESVFANDEILHPLAWQPLPEPAQVRK